MSAAGIALLGAVAGFTIFLGLPVGRLRASAPRLRALLNAAAIGVLLFLLWDVLTHAWEPIDGALAKGAYALATGDGLVLGLGLAVGLAGLVYFDQWVARRRRRLVTPAAVAAAAPVTTPAAAPVTTPAAAPGAPAPSAAPGAPAPSAAPGAPAPSAAPGAPAPSAAPGASEAGTGWRSVGGQLALLIAVGIGLHNFAEGLAIGNSAAKGEIALAVLLIVGFGLHNGTEGFGIVAPMAATGTRPSWGYLGVLGLIGGAPTFLGTIVGQRFTSETVSIAFLALAAGSILYVVIELLAVGRRMASKEIMAWGILAGLAVGFLTDAIVTAAGA